MIRWFAALTFRERVLLGGIVPVALGMALWQLVAVPLIDRRAELQGEIAAFRLVTLAAEGRAADPVSVTPPPAADPIATRITRSAEAAGLALRRLAPEGEALRVTLDDVAFADVILWVSDMEATQSIRVVAIEADRRPEPGVVSVRLLLEDAT